MKKSLILLPGLLTDQRIWQHQKQTLEAHANISIADYAQHDNLQTMADDILAQAPDTFALAGFSMGGYLALQIMRKAPERVTALALISTSAYSDSDEQKAFRQQSIDAAKQGSFAKVVSNTVNALLYPKAPNYQHSKELALSMATDIGADKFALHSHAIMQRPDSQALLAQINVPCLIAVGDKDRITPVKYSHELAKKIPTAKLTIIENAGHLLPLQAPEQLSQAMLQWLI